MNKQPNYTIGLFTLYSPLPPTAVFKGMTAIGVCVGSMKDTVLSIVVSGEVLSSCRKLQEECNTVKNS